MRITTLLAVARARLFKAPSPIAVGFELTHSCNLACAYCDRHTPLPREMSLPQIFRALEGLHDIGMREISLDGGEPLAHRHVADVVDWLRAHRIVVRMNTNGILVRRKADVVRRLAKVKISLDGPPQVHDAARGPRAFERALDGAMAARELGVPVELTCVVGRHNAHAIDELVAIAEWRGLPVIFQPARDSLFLGTTGPGRAYRLDERGIQEAFARVEAHKRRGAKVLNGWASLRHFRSFPKDTPIPCAAGFINVTMDPEGNLYHCGQVARTGARSTPASGASTGAGAGPERERHNVVELGAAEAFRRLTRRGCAQCWCARVVEENYAWGGRFDRSWPAAPRDLPARDPTPPDLVPAASLVRGSRVRSD